MNHEYDDEQLERVRGEIRAQAAALAERALLPRSAPAEPAQAVVDLGIDRARRSYRVGELTDVHHRTFVDTAFRALLKRAPDRSELETMLARLARGEHKVELLGDLRWSPEGRAVGARVGGLAPRYALAKAGRIPMIGYLLDTSLGLAGLAGRMRHQRAAETYFAARDEAHQDAQRSLADRLDRSDAATRALHDAIEALVGRIDGLHAFAHELALARDDLIRAIGAAEAALRIRIEQLEGTTAAVLQRLDVINHWTHALDDSFARIEAVADERDDDLERRATAVALAATATLPARAESARAVADAVAGTLPAGALVLTLAAGSDCVAQLVARGLAVVAAEPNERLLESLRDAGAVAEAVDAKALLGRCADASADGIVVPAASTITRSLPLVELLGEACRVLRAGGCLLLADGCETATLVDLLAGRATAVIKIALSRELLSAAGYQDVRSVDVADGRPCWLMRRGGA